VKFIFKGDGNGIEGKDNRPYRTRRNLKQQLKKESGYCTKRATKT
jgi:hypothetical protein